MKPNLHILDGIYTVHRMEPYQPIPPQVISAAFFSISKTADELSIVCPSSIPVQAEKSEGGWVCIKILGPLDFGLTGILAGIAGVLAQAEISIFALSTYDTDYILVKADKLEAAKQTLVQAAYTFVA